MLGVCLRPEEPLRGWQFVELQFEKSVSYSHEWRSSGSRFGVHAPYYVSLTSPKLQKVDDAINRVIEAADVARRLNADIVVVRAGFYSKHSPAEAMAALVANCKELLGAIDVPLGVETQPKPTQFGSLAEVLELAGKANIVPVLNLPAIAERGGLDLAILGQGERPYIHFNATTDLCALAAALPQKYTLVAEDVVSAEKMRALI